MSDIAGNVAYDSSPSVAVFADSEAGRAAGQALVRRMARASARSG